MYIYPDNLKSKATLWLWTLRDLAIIGIGSLISYNFSRYVAGRRTGPESP